VAVADLVSSRGALTRAPVREVVRDPPTEIQRILVERVLEVELVWDGGIIPSLRVALAGSAGRLPCISLGALRMAGVMEPDPRRKSASELADAAGATEADVHRMVELGILLPGGEEPPFRDADVQKVRLATACEQAGLPMDGIATAIGAGRLSFAFLEAAAFRRWAARSARTYREVSEESGLPFGVLRGALESMGYARMEPDDRIREDELEIVPLLQRGFATGVLDQTWADRIGRAFAESLRRIAKAENEVYHERLEMPLLRSGVDPRTAMETASEMGGEFGSLVDRGLLAVYRRQQELEWTEHLVGHVETELEEVGLLGKPERVPAMCFLDLVGYTRLTEEQGDEAAAATAASLDVLVHRSSRAHGGLPVKWLGDGVMFRFQEPAGAVLGALQMVEEIPSAGLPPAHVGVAAGRVVAQGGDYFGRTVNLASRIAARADDGQVLVSESVLESPTPDGVTFEELAEMELKGIRQPVRVFEARRA
jgi:adenylate cyclase